MTKAHVKKKIMDQKWARMMKDDPKLTRPKTYEENRRRSLEAHGKL